ncbi:hypothetical protein L3Q67_28240 [Saccharothrix sp. AJ9571]|nr:hypothetical protein L3Q67_28240 [Saccharothrix sp. AJ9571]
MSSPEHDLEKPTEDALDQNRAASPGQPGGPSDPELPLEADPADAAEQRTPADPRQHG